MTAKPWVAPRSGGYAAPVEKDGTGRHGPPRPPTGPAAVTVTRRVAIVRGDGEAGRA